MKFYLVKDAQAMELNPPTLVTAGWTVPTLSQLHVQEDEGDASIRDRWIKLQSRMVSTMFFETPPTRILSLIPMVSEKEGSNGRFWEGEVVEKCAKRMTSTIMKSVLERRGNYANLSNGAGGFKLSSLEITIVQLKENTGDDGKHTLLCVGLGETKDLTLRSLSQIFGRRVKLTLELYFGTRGGCPTRAGLVTSEMEISDTDGCFCIDRRVPVTQRMDKFWDQYSHSRPLSNHPSMLLTMARCNIILTVSDSVELFSDLLPADTNRRLLEEAIKSDFEIVASNGAVVKCHQSFLMVNSPVLMRMLETNMTESSTQQMKMHDTSEAGVRAFLTYLYCDDLNIAKQDLEIAFELLQAGHKYGIDRLERTMLRFFYDLPDVYISDDLVAKLKDFASRMPNGDILNEKLTRINYSEDEDPMDG